jgi:hypothetical protein
VIGPPFRVADYHKLAAKVAEHGGADVGGMGAFVRWMAILGAQGYAAAVNGFADVCNKGKGWTNKHVEYRV